MKDVLVVKRNGTVVPFDYYKIVLAIARAYDGDLVPNYFYKIANKIRRTALTKYDGKINVEKIQDLVEENLMRYDSELAREYVRFRYRKEVKRKLYNNYKSVLELVELANQDIKDENSNKNPIVASTQRDYIAGESSKTITKAYLLPKKVTEAHENGEIHFHDTDYYVQHIHNCCLVNLEDMLQNGTVINKTLIERPHSFVTACNIATQIMAVVASGQYGGQTVSLAHLAPFVNESRKRIKEEVIREFEHLGLDGDIEKLNEIVEQRVRGEITKGVQVLQYQINTLNTSNGQTPFVSVFMYLNEAKNEAEKNDLVMIIEEVLRQRIQGVKNEKGVWITPAFPKLLYVLEEDNTSENSKYWWLTELAAKCTAKRMVPDYISEKIMLRDKINANGEGNCYACMGCRSFLTPDRSGNGFGNIAKAMNYDGGPKYYGRLT